MERLRASRVQSLTWGTELGTVAISMDFTALGIWIYHPQLFPFFSKFNNATTTRDIQVWLIVLGIHFLLFIFSMIFKHRHNETDGLSDIPEIQDFLKKNWFYKNGWLFVSNSIGFVTLLTSIVVFTNSL